MLSRSNRICSRRSNRSPAFPKHTRRSILLACMLFAACVGVSGPKEFELPGVDPNLDPAALKQLHFIFACGEWIGGSIPSQDKIFVDVAFIRRDQASDPRDRPSTRHLATLRKHGGEVAYTFHFPAVRTWISTKSIPGLAADQEVKSVFRIVDLTRYDWNVDVGYRSRAAYNAGLVRFAEFGGQVNYQFEFINAIGGLMPDRSAADLRKIPEVEYVESSVPFPDCKS